MKIGTKLAHKMKYQQLSYEQRIEIRTLLKLEYTLTKIAQIVGVHKSTISREIKRNSGLRGYRPNQAHQRAADRRQGADKYIRFTDELQKVVKKYLKADWSPEQISGRLKKQNRPWVSHETIYQYVIADQENGGDLYTHLRCGRKKRRKRIKTNDRRGQIPNRVSIDERPQIVDEKKRIGDWEIDTIIGKHHKGAIVTAVERNTKFTCMRRVPKKEAVLVAKALVDMLKPYEHLVLTITSDNGKEFAAHEFIAKELEASFYFAHPYSSWERGLNENTNGLIRQYFPKKSCFLKIADAFVATVQDKLNDRPRKKLDFDTPDQLFSKSLVALGT